MALTKCKECGSEISNKTKACPICGAPRGPKQYSLGKLLIVLLFGWFICAIITTDHTTSSYGGAATELLNALISRTRRFSR